MDYLVLKLEDSVYPNAFYLRYREVVNVGQIHFRASMVNINCDDDSQFIEDMLVAGP